VAAVIERGGRFLLCRRPAGKRHAGLWEFPGGKFLPGESPLEAARRELAEELGVEVLSLGDRLLAAADPGSSFVVEFHRAAIAGEPRPLEHDELAWVAPEDFASYALAPSDRAMIEWIRRVE
jgi:8-oxo-dGTP diphosphatase